MSAVAGCGSRRLWTGRCNFRQNGDAIFSKNILQLSPKKACKKHQKRLDSIEKEMKALKKVTKSTESKVDNLQKAVKEVEGKFELIEADITNAEAVIMDAIDDCMDS